MGPERILIIRHAEQHGAPGIDSDGRLDEHSLTVRGWQRAGALIPFFLSGGALVPTPDAIFTSAVAPGSESRRPQQTVAPLHAVLRERGEVAYDERFTKPETEALMAEVMTRGGTVLIAWEHSCIPACVAALRDAPSVPSDWPDDRYDLVWSLERRGSRWTFTQIAQRLLVGDGRV
ncbi:histidine phosphatase family protein [Methylobacterium sp. NMS12]|uniref:histidine phosphatase family protein n=1 Tax=Methylobacterium sp. NMS12 TaxID=3079766 RepID=UPI003F8857D1